MGPCRSQGVAGIKKIRRRLLACLCDDVYNNIQGSTDSELAFALFIQYLGGMSTTISLPVSEAAAPNATDRARVMPHPRCWACRIQRTAADTPHCRGTEEHTAGPAEAAGHVRCPGVQFPQLLCVGRPVGGCVPLPHRPNAGPTEPVCVRTLLPVVDLALGWRVAHIARCRNAVHADFAHGSDFAVNEDQDLKIGTEGVLDTVCGRVNA